MNGGTQSRAGSDLATISEYASAMENDATFPPVDVYHDSEKYYLADGFDRVYARRRANVPGNTIAAIVHQGTHRNALLHSVGANATHGLRRTNVDKRLAVETLLKDEEWSQWSDREIARRCGVTNRFVSNIRDELTVNGSQSTRRKGVSGRVINTSNIGHRKQPQQPDNERISDFPNLKKWLYWVRCHRL